MLSYSPIDNVRRQRYPHILITACSTHIVHVPYPTLVARDGERTGLATYSHDEV
eukprot:COSAG01_NODE_8335_length_2824_cov_5.086972_1_plen_53_part_10